MKKMIALAAVAASLFSGSARANDFKSTDYESGNSLLTHIKECYPAVDAIGCGYAMGYIAGTIISAQRNLISMCVPNGVPVSQLLDIVQKYLNENPGMRHNSASDLVVVAVVKAFPCKKS